MSCNSASLRLLFPPFQDAEAELDSENWGVNHQIAANEGKYNLRGITFKIYKGQNVSWCKLATLKILHKVIICLERLLF